MAAAREALEKAGWRDGDAYPGETVPRLLEEGLLTLCYPPFAAAFVAYLHGTDEAAVEKTLHSIQRQALLGQDSMQRAGRFWREKGAGKSEAEIGGAESPKLSASTVKNILSYYRQSVINRPARQRSAKKKQK